MGDGKKQTTIFVQFAYRFAITKETKTTFLIKKAPSFCKKCVSF